MDNEQENKSVETQQTTPEKNIQEQTPPQTTEKKAEETSQESLNEKNFKEFREGRKQDRKIREEAERRAAEKEAEASALKAALESLVNKPQSTVPYQTNEPMDETEDQKIQRKVEQVLVEREKAREEQRRQEEIRTYPQKLANEFKDFSQVCSEENLDYLEYHYPEIAAPFKRLPDSYDKWADIYKAVKRFVPSDGKKEQKKAEKNFSKPQSMAVPGATPTGDTAPIYLDDKRRADNWARMQRVMRGAK
jgi:hypothetical protein